MELKDLTAQLLDFPRQMYEAEKKAEEAHERWLVAETKHTYDYSRAFLTNKASGLNDNQAKSQATVDVYALKMEVVKTESAWRRAAADHRYLENKFTAIRKIANLEEAALMKLGAPTGA